MQWSNLKMIFLQHFLVHSDPESPHDLRTGLRSSWSGLVHALRLEQVCMFAQVTRSTLILLVLFTHILQVLNRDSPYIRVQVGSGWLCTNSCTDSSQGTSRYTTRKSGTVVPPGNRIELELPRPIFHFWHPARTRDPIVPPFRLR